MSLIFSRVGEQFRNSATISDAIVINAPAVSLTNSESGRMTGGVTFTQGGSTLVNELGGIVRLGDGNLADTIAGSEGDERVFNGGLIIGTVALGKGNDYFVDQSGQMGALELGDGDDIFRVEGSSYRYLRANGGAGRDRVVLANTGYQIDGGGLTGFEDAVFETGGNYQNFSGFRSFRFSGDGFFNLIDSLNPNLDLTIDRQSAAMYRSSVRSITGGERTDSVSLGGGAVIARDINLGGGDDTLSFSSIAPGAAAPVIGGSINGGAGTDSLALRGDGTVHGFDLANFANFETIFVNPDYAANVVDRVSHVIDATQISIGGGGRLILSDAILPQTNVSGGQGGGFTLSTGSTIGRYGPPLNGPYDQRIDIVQGDDRQSVTIVNDGTILGEVKLGIGDDSYDGRAGSAGGTIYGNAGNDKILGGLGADTIDAGYGADRLEGNDGDDWLFGGAGSDVLVGGRGSDTLAGGTGHDVFVGEVADFAGDRINDLEPGDRISVIDAGADFAFSRNGMTLTIGAATIRIGIDNLRLITAPAGSQTDLVVATHWGGLSDFTGDGHSDILFRRTDGGVSTWAVSGNPIANQVRQGAFNGGADPAWKIVETFDMNGDGRSDILFRHDSGAVAVWGSTGAAFDASAYYRPSPVSASWRIVGAGDLDGDGRDDVLWQKEDSQLSGWLSTATGFQEAFYTRAAVGASWHVEGMADFSGDGVADILWRNENGAVAAWANNGSGTGFNEGAFYQPGVPTSWHIDGIGDFDGDGRDDILWRNDDGAVSVWRANGAGFDQGVFNSVAATSWHFAQTADFNDDGKADILWRNDDGALSTWQSNGAGFDQALYSSSADTNWAVAGHEFWG